MAATGKQITVVQYLISRLKEIGVDHLFGVPGDFALNLMKHMLNSKQFEYIGCCNELNAAYATDGYARIHGIGALVTTYAVGEISTLNGIAGAYAEGVPVVSIVGTPSRKAMEEQYLLHHTLGNYFKPFNMVKQVTIDAAFLEDPNRVPEEIDKVLTSCLVHQGPVYIAIPQDMVEEMCPAPKGTLRNMESTLKSNPDSLREAVAECCSMLNNAKKPIIVAGDGLIRYKLQANFSKLVEASGLPYATSIMGKCVIDENNPQFIGMYEGKSSREYVQNRVENADCTLVLGMKRTDFNTGGFTMKSNAESTIDAGICKVKIKQHFYEDVYLRDFIDLLCTRLNRRDPAEMEIRHAIHECVHRPSREYSPKPEAAIKLDRFFDRLSRWIKENSIVVAETGNAQFAAAETLMPKGTTFISQVFYGSIGYTLGATLGASIAAKERPVVLVIGDGSLQMTCQDISTMIRHGVRPTIFVINNDGYTIERTILDGVFNDIQPWNYHMLPEVFGGKRGFNIHTEGELEEALHRVEKEKELHLVEFHIDRWDTSKAMERLVAALKTHSPK